MVKVLCATFVFVYRRGYCSGMLRRPATGQRRRGGGWGWNNNKKEQAVKSPKAVLLTVQKSAHAVLCWMRIFNVFTAQVVLYAENQQEARYGRDATRGIKQNGDGAGVGQQGEKVK